MAVTDVDSDYVNVFRDPCVLSCNLRTPDRILVTAKGIYKVYANLGLSTQFMVR